MSAASQKRLKSAAKRHRRTAHTLKAKPVTARIAPERSPGPWIVVTNKDGSAEVYSRIYAYGYAVTGWGRVCQSLADAVLIAASPDGYTAAKDMLESARGVYGDNLDTYPAQWREQLRALAAFVAKAEGKS